MIVEHRANWLMKASYNISNLKRFKRMLQKFIICGLLFVMVLIFGCAIQPVNPGGHTAPHIAAPVMPDGTNAVVSSMQTLGGYTLKPADPIYVRFSGIVEQQALELVIDENGEIDLLHIDEPVVAAGLTTSELEDKIERLYIDGGIYKNVSVNVTMTAKLYYVQGEVNAPGQMQLVSGTTLMQAIAGARGLTPFASKKVTITRQGKIYTFNWKKLEKDPTLDVTIEAGDVIKVWQSWY
jgi:protein involved in polysaccharide export with SLBB domain